MANKKYSDLMGNITQTHTVPQIKVFSVSVSVNTFQTDAFILTFNFFVNIWFAVTRVQNSSDFNITLMKFCYYQLFKPSPIYYQLNV